MDLNSVCSSITSTNGKFAEEAQRRLDSLTKPQGSLGRLEDFARQLVAISKNPMPGLDKKVIFTFAGDHGVAEEGVSAFPKEVTPQMVLNFINGGAGINVLARHAGAEVVVVDIGVDHDFGGNPLFKKEGEGGFISRKIVSGTKNMRKGPAMSREAAEECVHVGIELANDYVKREYKIFGTGEMGIANTTPSSAITAVLTGKPVEEITGRGTGINNETWKNKVQVIKDAIAVNNPNPSDPIDVLAKVGGTEIGGITGLIIGAAATKIPVVVDGFISTAGALIAYLIEPKTKDYMFAAHMSQEIGHQALLAKMGLMPILDLNMRLGEGTGTALAMFVIEAGLKIYKEMATFAEAAVANRDSST